MAIYNQNITTSANWQKYVDPRFFHQEICLLPLDLYNLSGKSGL
jgi:hypothetical protein